MTEFYGSGCAPCGIERFDSTAEAVAHARTEEHKAITEQRRPVQQQEQRSGNTKRDRPVLPRGKPRMQEGKPWELYLPNSNILNVGSYAFGAVVGFVELAHDLLSEAIRTHVEGATFAQVERVAEALLEAADQAQAAVRPDDKVDRMDVSHTRSRGAIRTALKVYPFGWPMTDDDLKGWTHLLAEHAAAILRISFDLARRHEGIEFDEDHEQ